MSGFGQVFRQRCAAGLALRKTRWNQRLIDAVQAELPEPAVAMCGTPVVRTKHLSSHAARSTGSQCRPTGVECIGVAA
jgi:hypothetical protein